MLFASVDIEEKLPEGALKPRQTSLQHNKACPRQFRRKLEIHLSQRFAKVKMLLRLERIVAFLAEHMMLDITVRVGTIRHLVEWRIRNLCQLLVECRRQ